MLNQLKKVHKALGRAKREAKDLAQRATDVDLSVLLSLIDDLESDLCDAEPEIESYMDKDDELIKELKEQIGELKAELRELNA